MDRIDYLRRQFAYEHWANGHVLDALIAQDLEGSKAADLLAHILICQGAWLARFDGIFTDGWDFFPSFTLEQCRLLLDKNRGKYDEFLADMTEDRLDESRHYRNAMGEEFSSSFATALTHLFAHGVYHRGQIATHMRAAGKEPARTDYIFYDRGSA